MPPTPPTHPHTHPHLLALRSPYTALYCAAAGSMISSNVAVVAASGFQIVSAVFLLHSTGFALGYGLSKALGLSNKIARTNSIEVGMQSSALAAVLAKVGGRSAEVFGAVAWQGKCRPGHVAIRCIPVPR